MNRYDPDHAPNLEEWLALDEQLRIRLAEDYHRAKRIKLPNLKAHAVFHAIIENQIAKSLESVVRAMARLTAEGLSRHESIHDLRHACVRRLVIAGVPPMEARDLLDRGSITMTERYARLSQDAPGQRGERIG